MSKILPDLTGQKLGRLYVRRTAGTDSKKYKLYEVECDCGTIKLVRAALLHRGDVRSCGCLLKEARNRNIVKAQKQQTKHGLSGCETYLNWTSMMARCYNPKHDSYSRYGGLGIGVCGFLRSSPENLLSLIGKRPEKHYSIDRIDSKLWYSCGKCEECLKMGYPLNVKWSTPKEQAENRHNNIWITIDGQTKTCAEWSRVLGKSYNWVRRNHTDAKDYGK